MASAAADPPLELRRVGLAQDDGAGRPEPLDDRGVLVRDVVFEELRTEGRPHPFRDRHVLDPDRNAVERTQGGGATGERRRGAARLAERALAIHGDEGVHQGVDLSEAFEDRLHHLER